MKLSYLAGDELKHERLPAKSRRYRGWLWRLVRVRLLATVAARDKAHGSTLLLAERDLHDVREKR
jgi:hypothetical protein